MTQRELGHLEKEIDLRQRVLAAATSVFIEDGTVEASLEKVAGRAGIDVRVLMALFPTRIDLLAKLAGHLYVSAFPYDGTWRHRSDLASFIRTYLQRQERPEVRLVWHIGDVLAPVQPDRIDAAYWHLAGELELRLLDRGLAQESAHRCSLVLTPALMLVARRAAFDLTTQAELRDFVAAACGMADALVPGSG
ncbi:MAG TPA: TetR/AcrR family transcriptional regulator [Acidimicrobiales bacterium]